MESDFDRRGRATPSTRNLGLCLLLAGLALGSCRGKQMRRDPASRLAEAAERFLMQEEDPRQVYWDGAEELDEEGRKITMRAQYLMSLRKHAESMDNETFAACMRVLDPGYRFVLARSEAEKTRVLCNALWVSKGADLKTLFHWARDPRPLVQEEAFGAIGVVIADRMWGEDESKKICDELIAYLAEDLPPASIAKALGYAALLGPGREVPEEVVANLARKAQTPHHRSRYLAAGARLIREGGGRLPSRTDLAEYIPVKFLTPTEEPVK